MSSAGVSQNTYSVPTYNKLSDILACRNMDMVFPRFKYFVPCYCLKDVFILIESLSMGGICLLV